MPYKPKFCCQCGEKIERIDWKLWTSRRFCELCETDFGVYEKLPAALAAFGVIFGIIGLVSYWRAPEKALNLAPNQFVGAPNVDKPEKNQTTSPQISSNSSVQTKTENSTAQTKTEIASTAPNLKTKAVQTEAQETVYFCGAMTKKGTPCSRRVKGGGRCWQHAGQTATMPQEKLIVGNN